MKRCKVCGKLKLTIEYYANYRYTDRLFSTCKKCCKKQRDRNKKRISEVHKIYYQNNKEKLKVKSRFYSDRIRFGITREEILSRDFHTCQDCKIDHHQIRLDVHHSDGRGRGMRNPNNQLDNLITLCHSCHMARHKGQRVKKNGGGKSQT